MSNPMKFMDVKQFVELGLLQEINRQFLHPRGLALCITADDRDDTYNIEGIWDFRDDPVGGTFGELDPKEAARKASSVYMMAENKREAREAELGYFIQPIPDSDENPT